MGKLFKTNFTTPVIVLIPACIGINYLGKLFAAVLKLPLWLDCIGTCIGAILGGPVIGGISFLLYGMIGTSGLRILVDNHVDYSKNRNMILTSVIFVTGLSGVTLALGDVSLSGMTLAAIVGMIMSLVFYAFDKFHLSNDA